VVAGALPAIGAVRDAADAAPDASFRLIGEPVHDTDQREAAPPPSWSPERPAPAELRGSPADGIVVHRGDTLWSIAARHLDPMATAADIDAECHRWFAANRDVIGQDPDVILPGQLLSPPPKGDS
jgi:nucleoid-associated protein YgaU